MDQRGASRRQQWPDSIRERFEGEDLLDLNESLEASKELGVVWSPEENVEVCDECGFCCTSSRECAEYQEGE